MYRLNSLFFIINVIVGRSLLIHFNKIITDNETLEKLHDFTLKGIRYYKIKIIYNLKSTCGLTTTNITRDRFITMHIGCDITNFRCEIFFNWMEQQQPLTFSRLFSINSAIFINGSDNKRDGFNKFFLQN